MGEIETTVAVPSSGVFIPVPTFFMTGADSTSLPAVVDVETQIKHSIFLARSGITGKVLLESTGEAIHLSRHERIDLVANVKKGLEDAGVLDYYIMAGVLTNSEDKTLE